MLNNRSTPDQVFRPEAPRGVSVRRRQPSSIRLIALLSGLLCSTVIASPTHAWFLTTRLAPSSKTLAGVPVETVDPALATVVVPTLQDVPIGNDIGVADIRNGDVYFDRIEDLNGDGTDERVLCGAFQAKDGTYGRFIAIFDWRNPQDPRLMFMDKLKTDPGFAFLQRVRGDLIYSFCLYCGSFSRVHWTGTRFMLLVDEKLDDEG